MVNKIDEALASIREKTNIFKQSDQPYMEYAEVLSINDSVSEDSTTIDAEECIFEKPKYKEDVLMNNMDNSIILKIDKPIFFKSLLVSFIIGIIFGTMITSLLFFGIKLKSKDIELEKRAAIYSIIDVKNEELIKKDEMVSSLEDTIFGLNNSILELENDKLEMIEELDVFRKRDELYNKYEYILSVDNKKTDITYEQLEFGEKEMAKRGLNPHLLYSVIRIESRGSEKIKNSKSTATGYCQFLKGTARWVYQDLLKKGTYTHDKALDGFISLEMGAEYLSYLMKSNKGDVYKSLLSYNGGELGSRYYQLVDSVLVKNTDTNLNKIQTEYRKTNL